MTASSRKKNYVRGLTSSYVVTFATILVGLWLTPFTLRFLDREQFAVFTLAADVLMWLGLLEIGLISVLNVKAAQLFGTPDQQQLNTLASTTFFGQLVIALVMLLAGSGLTCFFPDFFALRPDLRDDSIKVMALMVLGSALTVATQTFSALLVAHQQIHIDNIIKLALIIVRTGLTIVLLINGYGLVSLAIAHLVAVVFTTTLAVYRVRHLLPGLCISWANFSKEILLSTTGTGIWFSLGGFAGIMIMYLDKIVTAKVVSVDMVTTLILTGRLYTLAWSVIQQITNTARPALAQIIGKGDLHHAYIKFQQISLVSTGIAIIAVVSIWAGNASFVTWWVGAQNYGGNNLDIFLAINLVVNAWILPNRAILTAGLIVKPQTLSRIAEGFLNLSLSIVLGLQFGVIGVVLSTAIAGVLTSFWYLPFLTHRFFGYPISRFFKMNVSILVLLVMMIPIAMLIRSALIGISGFLPAISIIAFTGAAGLVLMWWFVLDRGTRSSVMNLLGQKV